jgi:hypothetical protein
MPSPVQVVSGTINSGGACNITLSPTGPGNTLVILVGESQDTTNPKISGITIGGSADNFASCASNINNTECNAEIWYDPAAASGQTALVVTFTAGTGTNQGQAVWAVEWPGILSLDKHPAGTGTGSLVTSWASPATGTLSQPTEVIFGVVMCESGSTAPAVTGPSSNWTNLSKLAPQTTLGMIAGYWAVSAITSETYSGTVSPSSLYGACIASFEAPPSGSATWDAGGSVTLGARITGSAAWDAGGSVTLGARITGSAAWDAGGTITLGGSTTNTATWHAGGTFTARVELAPAATWGAGGSISLTGTATTPVLLCSMSATADSDAWGNSWPAGFYAAAGLIEGPTFMGDDFEINSAGAFFYSATPALGNLVASNANSSGTDQYGNAYQAGSTVYGSGGSYAQMTEGHIFFQGASGQSSPAYVTASGAAGLLELSSGTITGGDSPALIDLLSADANGGQSAINLTSADQVLINGLIVNGQQITGLPVPLGYPLSPSAPLATVVDCLNSLISGFITAGVIS